MAHTILDMPGVTTIVVVSDVVKTVDVELEVNAVVEVVAEVRFVLRADAVVL